MRNLSILFFIFVSSSIFSQTVEKNTPDTILVDSKFTLYQIVKHNITILAFKEDFEFVYNISKIQTFATYSKNDNFEYAINGSFFESNFTHAGYLSIFGKVKTKLKKDLQLTHLLFYDYSIDSIGIQEYNSLDISKINFTQSVIFQTGPLVINKDSICEGFIANSINGNSTRKRTLLAYDNDNTKYFIVVKEGITLIELAFFLKNLSIFENKEITVINLDGGPSVSFYSKNHPEYNFNINSKLPIILGVK